MPDHPSDRIEPRAPVPTSFAERFAARWRQMERLEDLWREMSPEERAEVRRRTEPGQPEPRFLIVRLPR